MRSPGKIDLSKTVDEMLSLLKVSVTKRALIQADLEDYFRHPGEPARRLARW